MRRRVPTILLAVAALAMTPASDAARGNPIPERIVSKRVRILTEDRYRELRSEWGEYTEAHPGDPMGWSELAKAARYAGAPCEEYIQYAEKAVRLAPDDAGALGTLGSYRWRMYCPSQPEDPGEAARLLERALTLDPSLEDPHYTLWVMRLSQGRQEEAARHLRALLDGGHFPEPLVDLAHNMLVGVEPNAIILTNGDNDTYPPLALQAARRFRTDVAVVNLSLLNTAWYRRQLRDGALRVPVPLLEGEVKGPPSPAAIAGLIESLGRDGWKRPLYAAVTVDREHHRIPNRLSLEGVVYRVLPEQGDGPEIAGDRLERNLEGLYRLDSATSFAIDWDAWSSLRPLMLNYAVAGGHLASSLAGAGDMAHARAAMDRALALCQFHRSPRFGRDLIEEWSGWDPKSPELGRWKKKFEP